jgi:hypothetical protein
MIRDVEYTDEFGAWWDTLTGGKRDAVAVSVRLLIDQGPQLGFPHSTAIRSFRHPRMRELRTQQGGRQFRTLYAFDPRRNAILLIGGDKTMIAGIAV